MTDITLNGHRLTPEQSSWLVGSLHHERAYCSTPGELLELLSHPTPPPAPEVSADLADILFRARSEVSRARGYSAPTCYPFTNDLSALCDAVERQAAELARVVAQRDALISTPSPMLAEMAQRAEAAERAEQEAKAEYDRLYALANDARLALNEAGCRGYDMTAMVKQLVAEREAARSTPPAAPSELQEAHAAIWAMAEDGWLCHGDEGMSEPQQLVSAYTLKYPKERVLPPRAAEEAAPIELARELQEMARQVRSEGVDDAIVACELERAAAALSRREPTPPAAPSELAERLRFLSEEWLAHPHGTTEDPAVVLACDSCDAREIIRRAAAALSSVEQVPAAPSEPAAELPKISATDLACQILTAHERTIGAHKRAIEAAYTEAEGKHCAEFARHHEEFRRLHDELLRRDHDRPSELARELMDLSRFMTIDSGKPSDDSRLLERAASALCAPGSEAPEIVGYLLGNPADRNAMYFPRWMLAEAESIAEANKRQFTALIPASPAAGKEAM